MVRRVRKSYTYHYFSKLFKARILGLIFHRFRKLFGFIFRTFWHHFSILFRHWYLVGFLMSFLSDFGRKSIDRKESGRSLFAHFFPYFPRPWFWHRFWWIFDDFCSIWGRFWFDFNLNWGRLRINCRLIFDDFQFYCNHFRRWIFECFLDPFRRLCRSFS